MDRFSKASQNVFILTNQDKVPVWILQNGTIEGSGTWNVQSFRISEMENSTITYGTKTKQKRLRNDWEFYRSVQ